MVTEQTQPMVRGSDDGFEAKTVGRYLVLHRLGSGGMGVVLAAYDPELDRRVALKVVRTEPRATGVDGVGPDAATARARLAREAQTLARLNHPNVVTVYDVGTHGGDPGAEEAHDPGGVFVAMELIDGTNLSRWMRDEQPTWPEIRRVFLDAGRGLAAAHEVGVVHRDFKASNVLLTLDDGPRGPIGRVCVTDFGLARSESTLELSAAASMGASHGSDDALRASVDVPDVELTAQGKVVGTPAYMAPEQHQGRIPDHRADQYAFCITLFEAIWGRRPFDGSSAQELAAQKARGLRGRVPSPRVRVPLSVRRCIFRGLHPNPNHRHRNMHVLLAELERASKWRPLSVAVVAGMATGLAGIVAIQSSDPPQDPCHEGRDAIHSVWTPEVRDQLELEFSRASSRVGQAHFESAAKHIDRFAVRWSSQYDDACRATWQRGEQSQARLRSRLSCLRHRVHGLDAVLQLLQDPDPAIVRRATDIVLSLPSVDDCSDPRRLPRVSATPPDPLDAARVDDARRRLTSSRTQLAAGRFDQALHELESLTQGLGPWADDGLRSEVTMALGRAQDDTGDHQTAVITFMQAAEFARRAADPRLEARAWMNLARTHGERLRDFERGRFYLDLAEASVGVLPADDSFVAALAFTRGRVMFAAGRDDEAHAALLRAAELREGLYGAGDYRVAEVQAQLAGALMRRNELASARTYLLRARETYERVFGARHTRVATARGNLGIVLSAMGDYEGAIEEILAGRSIFRDTFGETHPAVATADDTLGEILRRDGQLERSAARFDSSIACFERLGGPKNPDLVNPLMGLAEVELAREHPERARTLLERARALSVEVTLPPVQWGDLHLALAEAHAALDDPAAAREALTQTREPYQALDPRDDRHLRVSALRRALDSPDVARP